MKKIYLLAVLTSLLFISCSVEDTDFKDNTQNNSELSVTSKAVSIEFKTNTTQINKNILKEDLNVLKVIEINSQNEVWIIQTNYTNELLTDIIMFNNFVEQITIENENNFLTREGDDNGTKDSDSDESEEERTGDSGTKDSDSDESEEERTGDSGTKDSDSDESEEEKTGDSGTKDSDSDESEEERNGN